MYTLDPTGAINFNCFIVFWGTAIDKRTAAMATKQRLRRRQLTRREYDRARN